jgi:molybdenum cofactor cytidylyltransferase
MILPTIVLAGGASRRLGQAKQLVRVGSETLLERTVRVAVEAQTGPIVVVLGAEWERIAAETKLGGCVAVVNANWEQGIATSICCGLAAVVRIFPGAPGVMLLVADQPRLTSAHLRLLAEAFEARDWRVAVASEYAGVAGIPAIFPAKRFGELLALTGDQGARGLLRDAGVVRVPFPEGGFDVDTPGDLAKL